MLPNVPGYREHDFISISKSEYKELQEQNSERIIELITETSRLRELLRRGLKPLNSAKYKVWREDVDKELDAATDAG